MVASIQTRDLHSQELLEFLVGGLLTEIWAQPCHLELARVGDSSRDRWCNLFLSRSRFRFCLAALGLLPDAFALALFAFLASFAGLSVVLAICAG